MQCEPTLRQLIVVVEDDSSMLRAIGRLLQASGFAVAAHESAESLLASRDAAEAACLVIDIHLPGLSGLELQERLVAAGLSRPVVFITAIEAASSSEGVQHVGAACLFKPFPGRLLLGAIAQAIESGIKARPTGQKLRDNCESRDDFW